MKAVIYLRSATKQEDNRSSIREQELACLKYAKDSGYFISGKRDIYRDEGFSGINNNRPAFKRMMKRLGNDSKVKLIIAKDSGRISRNRVEFFKTMRKFKQLKKKFISVVEGIGSNITLIKNLLNTKI